MVKGIYDCSAMCLLLMRIASTTASHSCLQAVLIQIALQVFFNLARCPWITAFPFFCGIVGLQPVFLPTYISLTFPFLKHQGILSNAILFLYSGPGTACRIMPNALTLLQPAKEFASNQPLPSHCKLLCLLRVT